MGHRMTVKEVVQHTGFSEYAVRRMCKQGVIPYISVGRRIFIDIDMFEKALELQAEENQKIAKANAEALRPKEVVHYGNFKDLLK